MTNRRQRRLRGGTDQPDFFGRPPSLHQLSRYLGEVVYFIRCPDGSIKIGYTNDLANRASGLGTGWTGILALLPGGPELEDCLHQRFRPHRARGREYFNPAPDLLAFVNDLRVKSGVRPVAPWGRVSLAPLTALDKNAEGAS